MRVLGALEAAAEDGAVGARHEVILPAGVSRPRLAGRRYSLSIYRKTAAVLAALQKRREPVTGPE
jgi:hypothetical protein